MSSGQSSGAKQAAISRACAAAEEGATSRGHVAAGDVHRGCRQPVARRQQAAGGMWPCSLQTRNSSPPALSCPAPSRPRPGTAPQSARPGSRPPAGTCGAQGEAQQALGNAGGSSCWGRASRQDASLASGGALLPLGVPPSSHPPIEALPQVGRQALQPLVHLGLAQAACARGGLPAVRLLLLQPADGRQWQSRCSPGRRGPAGRWPWVGALERPASQRLTAAGPRRAPG